MVKFNCKKFYERRCFLCILIHKSTIVSKIAEDNKVVIVFDHTTCENRFVILSFMLNIGKRGIPLYYKVYEYNDPKNKSIEDVKEGLRKVEKLIKPYNYYDIFYHFNVPTSGRSTGA